jgi:hypothetical protein
MFQVVSLKFKSTKRIGYDTYSMKTNRISKQEPTHKSRGRKYHENDKKKLMASVASIGLRHEQLNAILNSP